MSFEARSPMDCMICDLYAVIDQHGNTSSDFVADLVTVLPPRGHGMHNLAIWEQTYRSRRHTEDAP